MKTGVSVHREGGGLAAKAGAPDCREDGGLPAKAGAPDRREDGGLAAKKTTGPTRRVLGFALAALALAAGLAAGLVSCSQQTQTSASSEGAPYGSPWVSSVFTDNLPDATPTAADDLYLHYSYDYAAAHQKAVYASVAADAQGELQAAVTAIVKSSSVESPELEQLRLFYNQAADLDAVEAAGADELKPYLLAVLDTQSLDELEEVLLSEDFPFSPWIETNVSAPDMKSDMCVAVMPHMLFSDAESGADLYRDADNENAKDAIELTRSQKKLPVETDLSLLSIAEDDSQAAELAERMFDLEKSYGKDEDAQAYRDAGYGAQAQAVKFLTFDELAAACPNFPMRKTLAKLGENTGEGAIVMYPEWLSSFNDVWTEENFELLRTMTAVKVLRECSDFIAPSLYANMRAKLRQNVPTADEFAYAACNKVETFAQLLAKTYVEQELGARTAEKLEALANGLIDSYIDLVEATPWLDAQSREAIVDKIDNMALNVLYPDGGYFDYSGLKLTPSNAGGTLLGNYLAIKAYNDRLEAALIGKPARASATWLYVRPTLRNCFYDSVSNSVNIFPGYVTSAVYSEDMSAEELLAGMGFTVAHEISHAFDYSGSQFDAYGRPIAVFIGDDVQEFLAIRQKIAERYSTFEVLPGVYVDGEVTSVEATADLCGLQAALAHARSIEGFDYEKFFGRFALSWATTYSSAYANLLLADAHAPANLRVNASAQMVEEFYSTYGVAEGDAMYVAPDDRIAMWG